jgi:hypothetical protein
VTLDSLKVLDPEWPIREADIVFGGSSPIAAPASAFPNAFSIGALENLIAMRH